MSTVPPSVGVEKALFASPPSIASTSTTAQPQCAPSSAAAPTPLAPSGSTATVGAATGASVLSPACAAKISNAITDDLRQLSRDDLDVKRWLNATLSRVMETAKDASAALAADSHHGSKSAPRKSLQLEEQLVQLLHARVQTHSQELGAGIEDLISNTLVRLPRTTMELGRMRTEAEELTGQLHTIEAIVQPAVQAKSDTYVAQLHTRKASEVKLRRCTELLEKAARVQESIRNIEYLIEHREAKAANRKGEVAASASPPSTADTASATDATSKTTATRQRDLDEVAGIIRQAREDLKEITAVDDTFGEPYKAQLAHFEQYIEQALEEECVACLRAHQLERGTRLITTLHSIGRADAVLKRYGEQAAAQMVERQAMQLREASSRGASQGSSAAASVAELLRTAIIPDDSAFLSQELTFLASLVRGAAAALATTTTTTTTKATAPATANGTAVKANQNTVAAEDNDDASSASASPTAKGPSTSSSSGTAVEEDPRAAQVLEVLEVLLSKLHAPVHAALQPLLTEGADTTNKDFVACFTAIQQLKVSATTTAAASPSTSAVALTAKDPLEKLAREVTHRALVLFARLFQEEKVLERYAERVCTPVTAFCAQPLAKILASSSSASVSSSAAPSSAPSPSRVAAAAAAEDSLAHLLIQASQEVLLFVPEKISARCTTAWHAQLSKTLTEQLRPTSATSQHVLLQHLYLCKQRVKPLLVKTQLAVEDWLSSGAMHERYPTSAGLLRADLQSRLWTPLRVSVEEVQRATQQSILHGITRPILAKVEAYTTLPCWGNGVTARAGSPAAHGATTTAAAATRSQGLYTQGQVAPSGAVRDVGELLMELPLTLETLASTAVAESYHGTKGSATGSPSAIFSANDTDAEEGVRMLIDEQAEEWLETVVRDVVRAFLDEKVLPLTIGPFTQPPSAVTPSPAGDGQVNGLGAEAVGQLYATALEQLTTDLDYLRNILSAVNEESQETVERVMSALQALPTTQQASFVVGEEICMTTSTAAAEGGPAETTQSGVYQNGSD